MAQTVAQAASKYIKRLQRLKELPAKAIAAAHNSIMGEIPVYTGTYQDAILPPHPVPDGVSVALTLGGLMSSAQSHAEDIREMALPHGYVRPETYVTGKPDPSPTPPFWLWGPGSEPYPLRIERQASPLGEGQNAWLNAARIAAEVIGKALQRIGGSA